MIFLLYTRVASGASLLIIGSRARAFKFVVVVVIVCAKSAPTSVGQFGFHAP